MFLFLFLIVYLCLVIAAAIAHIFSPIVKIIIPTGIRRKETKSKIKIDLVIAETKMKKCWI